MIEDEKQEEITPLDVDDFLVGFFYAWMKDGDPDAKTAIWRYCEYIRFHGYPDFVFAVVDSLRCMDMGSIETWIRQTHAQYSQDDRAMLSHIFGVKNCVQVGHGTGEDSQCLIN